MKTRLLNLFKLVVPLMLLALVARAEDSDPFNYLRGHVSNFRLSNGLRVVFFKRDTAPVFSAQIFARVGGVNEKPGHTGIAHFLEHMAFKGTTTIGTTDYSRERALLEKLEQIVATAPDQDAALKSPEVQKIYAELSPLWVDNELGRLYSLGGEMELNAQTAKDYTAYVISLPSSSFELWCWLESDRLLNPVFRQFYKEREVVQEERRRNFDDEPGGRLYEKLLDVAYQVHPYKYPNIGYSADLKHVTATQMKEFYAQYYRPDNLVIGIVGDLDEATLREKLEAYFGRMRRGVGPVPDVKEVEPDQQEERHATISFDALPQLLIGYHKPSYPNPDDAKLAILHSLLSDGRSSVLEKTLVRDKRVAVNVFSTEAPGERFPSLFVVGAVPKTGVSSAALRDEIQAIFDNFKAANISSAELEAAKRRVRAGFISGLDSDMELAETLARTELFYGDWRKIFDFYNTMASTTAEDLERIVRTYLVRSNSTFVSIVPEEKR